MFLLHFTPALYTLIAHKIPTSAQNFENEETLAYVGVQGIPPAPELSPVQQRMVWQQINGDFCAYTTHFT